MLVAEEIVGNLHGEHILKREGGTGQLLALQRRTVHLEHRLAEPRHKPKREVAERSATQPRITPLNRSNLATTTVVA